MRIKIRLKKVNNKTILSKLFKEAKLQWDFDRQEPTSGEYKNKRKVGLHGSNMKPEEENNDKTAKLVRLEETSPGIYESEVSFQHSSSPSITSFIFTVDASGNKFNSAMVSFKHGNAWTSPTVFRSDEEPLTRESVLEAIKQKNWLLVAKELAREAFVNSDDISFISPSESDSSRMVRQEGKSKKVKIHLKKSNINETSYPSRNMETIVKESDVEETNKAVNKVAGAIMDAVYAYWYIREKQDNLNIAKMRLMQNDLADNEEVIQFVKEMINLGVQNTPFLKSK